MANTTNKTTRIKHVFGNVLKLAIPLTLRTVTLEGGNVVVEDTDYTPSNHYPVVVQFVNGPLKYELNATMRDNYIAVVEDKGTIPVGRYAIVVLCKDDNGDPRRFKQRCVLEVVDVTADAGIEVGIEFEAQEWLLDGAIFLAVKGEDGIDGVGIESITTDETSVSGDYNQVTFHLTNGTSYTLNVRNGESTEQTLPKNVVIDEHYVHTDNNYTNTDKSKVENIDKLFGDVEYDRLSRRLNFFKHGDTTHTNPLKSIDITDFVRDGRVSSFRIIDGNLTIKLNSDGNNEEFKVPISSIAENYYTKTQTDSRIWNAIEGAGIGGQFVVTITKTVEYDDERYSADRTANQIYEAHQSGKNVIAKYGDSVGQLLYCESGGTVFLFSEMDGGLKTPLLVCADDLWWVEEQEGGTIEIDDNPTADSGNAVSSGGTYLALSQKVSGIRVNNGNTQFPDNGIVNLNIPTGGYTPPVGGIPKSDLASGVQASLNKADTALQQSDLSGYATQDDVDDAISGLVNGAPAALDTLKELADALGDDPNFATTMATQLGNKVDKETGKGLSTNDYTTAEKQKLAGIEVGAKANVNADWNASSGDAQILNKPTIPSKISELANDAGYTSNTGTVTGISVNGEATQLPTNGVVNLTIGTGGPNDIVGVTTTQQGTIIFTKRNNDTVTVDLNHVHPQYLKYELLADEAAYNALATKDSSTLYLIPEE